MVDFFTWVCKKMFFFLGKRPLKHLEVFSGWEREGTVSPTHFQKVQKKMCPEKKQKMQLSSGPGNESWEFLLVFLQLF